MPPNPPNPWEVSEQEVVAKRIEEKANSFSNNTRLKYNSLPTKKRQQLLEEFKTFIDSLNWTSPKGNYYGFRLNNCNGFTCWGYTGRDLILDFIKPKDGDRDISNCFWDSYLKNAFQAEEENWIRLAVFFEEGLEKITTKFKELYQTYQKSLDPLSLELSQDVYNLLDAVEKALAQSNGFLTLLQDTIFFLRDTKGIFKSKRVQEYRERLGEELKKAGFPDPCGRY